MATPQKKRGSAGKIYRNTVANPGQTFNEVESAMDIKLGDSWSTFDASTRGSLVKKFLAGQQDWSLEFSVLHDPSDVDQIALRAAYRLNNPVDLFVADGASDVPGSSGPNCEWLITEYPIDMPLADGMKITIKCVPHGNCSFEPQYLTMS